MNTYSDTLHGVTFLQHYRRKKVFPVHYVLHVTGVAEYQEQHWPNGGM